MAGSHTFQAPKGTRDFYPADMAVRRYIERVWREVSINHGFEEVDGPTFEHLDLYTVKSGPGIVSELFSFRRAGGGTDYALRPEFTPTLARMVAARATQLPKPIKWFCLPNFFRAERPQRGRLREFMQWNVDILGVPDDGTWRARAEVESVAVLIDSLRSFGLGPHDVRVKFGDRSAIRNRLQHEGRQPKELDDDLVLLDDRSKLKPSEYRKRARERGWSEHLTRVFDPVEREIVRLDANPDLLPLSPSVRDDMKSQVETPGSLLYETRAAGIEEWCEYDSMIVRGLAYYTGLVFEAHEATGAERAIAGGGRYDKLVELFGGSPTPAVGFAMGDVVLSLVLRDKGLLKPAEEYLPRPDVFVIALDDAAANELPRLVAQLRHEGLHARHSSKSTRNVGKLLGEASKARARFAVILGNELSDGIIALKNLETGEQRDVKREALVNELRSA